MPALNAQSAILDICREFSENLPKAGRIGKSFLVLLGCPSGRYYLGTTLAHSRSRVINEDGDVFKMAATAKRVRRTGVKINKMAEKAEVQFMKKKEKQTRFAGCL